MSPAAMKIDFFMPVLVVRVGGENLNFVSDLFCQHGKADVCAITKAVVLIDSTLVEAI